MSDSEPFLGQAEEKPPTPSQVTSKHPEDDVKPSRKGKGQSSGTVGHQQGQPLPGHYAYQFPIPASNHPKHQEPQGNGQGQEENKNQFIARIQAKFQNNQRIQVTCPE